MRIGPTIHYNAGHNYIHYSAGADELAIMHGNRFSPWEDFFINAFSSVLTITQDITMYCKLLLEEANTHSGTVGLLLRSIMNHNCFVNHFTSEDY